MYVVIIVHHSNRWRQPSSPIPRWVFNRKFNTFVQTWIPALMLEFIYQSYTKKALLGFSVCLVGWLGWGVGGCACVGGCVCVGVCVCVCVCVCVWGCVCLCVGVWVGCVCGGCVWGVGVWGVCGGVCVCVCNVYLFNFGHGQKIVYWQEWAHTGSSYSCLLV